MKIWEQELERKPADAASTNAAKIDENDIEAGNKSFETIVSEAL